MNHSDKNLGGRDLDLLISGKFGREFSEENDCKNPTEDPKKLQKMLKAAETLRKALSLQDHYEVSIEAMDDDTDLEMSLNREEFEDLIKDVTE